MSAKVGDKLKQAQLDKFLKNNTNLINSVSSKSF